MVQKPTLRPADPHFSSGPTKKRPGWSFAALAEAPIGRSHAASVSRARLCEAIERTAALLAPPADYRVMITPASDTGAFEAAMWSLLGARGVDLFSSDEFGRRWLTDARDQLRLSDLRIFEAPFGEAPAFNQADFDRDVVFVWNATSAGVRPPDGDWIAPDRAGLTICDATSAAFAMDLPWEKLDVTTFSWQKCMGGEAQHGMAILSPRARARLAEHRPPWPVPRILQLFKGADEASPLYAGGTLNTPSLLCVEDYLDALKWAAREGGLSALIARTQANFGALSAWVENTPWAEFLCADPLWRSPTSVTLRFADPIAEGPEAGWALSRRMGAALEREGAAFDILPHISAPPGLRIWCGPTVDADDVAALGPWLDWAFETARAEAAAA